MTQTSQKAFQDSSTETISHYMKARRGDALDDEIKHGEALEKSGNPNGLIEAHITALLGAKDEKPSPTPKPNPNFPGPRPAQG